MDFLFQVKPLSLTLPHTYIYIWIGDSKKKKQKSSLVIIFVIDVGCEMGTENDWSMSYIERPGIFFSYNFIFCGYNICYNDMFSCVTGCNSSLFFWLWTGIWKFVFFVFYFLNREYDFVPPLIYKYRFHIFINI